MYEHFFEMRMISGLKNNTETQGTKFYDATKAPRHQVAQSIVYLLNNLGDSFVSWCLGGKKTLVAKKAFRSKLRFVKSKYQ